MLMTTQSRTRSVRDSLRAARLAIYGLHRRPRNRTPEPGRAALETFVMVRGLEAIGGELGFASRTAGVGCIFCSAFLRGSGASRFGLRREIPPVRFMERQRRVRLQGVQCADEPSPRRPDARVPHSAATGRGSGVRCTSSGGAVDGPSRMLDSFKVPQPASATAMGAAIARQSQLRWVRSLSVISSPDILTPFRTCLSHARSDIQRQDCNQRHEVPITSQSHLRPDNADSLLLQGLVLFVRLPNPQRGASGES